ncbi:MAG: hypothetical protein KGM95_02340 [Betaproteobacteria bacterium]|nr:hypothetical protein [Betaproteobacteria bacterium]
MYECAIYIRTQEGHIKRLENIVSGFPNSMQVHYGSLSHYVHEERLVGFPESIVLWANSTGPSVGIAPLIPHWPGENTPELGVC